MMTLSCRHWGCGPQSRDLFLAPTSRAGQTNRANCHSDHLPQSGREPSMVAGQDWERISVLLFRPPAVTCPWRRPLYCWIATGGVNTQTCLLSAVGRAVRLPLRTRMSCMYCLWECGDFKGELQQFYTWKVDLHVMALRVTRHVKIVAWCLLWLGRDICQVCHWGYLSLSWKMTQKACVTNCGCGVSKMCKFTKQGVSNKRCYWLHYGNGMSKGAFNDPSPGEGFFGLTKNFILDAMSFTLTKRKNESRVVFQHQNLSWQCGKCFETSFWSPNWEIIWHVLIVWC